MNKIVFSGTFDPVTTGHFWVIKEALNIADEVVVMIGLNPTKKPMFSIEQRKEFIDKELEKQGIANRVKVMIVRNEYIALKAKQIGAEYMVRGIRSAVDFDYEGLIQNANTDVLNGAKTMFLIAPSHLGSVSSSFVKAFLGPVGWHHHIKKFIPENVYEFWIRKFIKDEFQTAGLIGEKYDNFLNLAFDVYSKERYYHNLEHIVHCLQELIWVHSNYDGMISKDEYRQLLVALVGHDIVYGKNNQKTDEQLSAELVLNLLGEEFRQAHDLVLVTQHLSEERKANLSKIEKLMISIDLAILGQSDEIYVQYTKNIRKEYPQYDDSIYSSGRKQAMSKILSNQILFPSECFEHYEVLSRKNIEKEINQ